MAGTDWHVLGAGAIGSLFAASLTRAGVDCTLLLRNTHGDRRDLRIEENGRVSTSRLPCSAVDDPGPISWLLLATKAHQAMEALLSVQQRLADDATIMLLMNGMGLHEEVCARFPVARVYCATTTEGAYRRSPDHIVHAGRGATLVGSPEGRTAPGWFGAWQSMDLDCRWSTDIRLALWHKLAINCAINPLTAVHGCLNGELVKNAALRKAMAGLCDEIAVVSEALGFETTAREVHATAEQVVRATAENRSSMLQDVSAGRPTEIDYITGYLVARAEAVGIQVPCNRALLETLRNG